MKKHIVSFVGIFLLISMSMLMGCHQRNNDKEIVVHNSLDHDRSELISIPYRQFSETIQPEGSFKILNKTTGIEVPYQLEMLGKEDAQNILMKVSVPASGKIILSVEEGEPAPVQPSTYARYVPERFDDFAWENDQIAFRMYGKALEGRPDDAQGVDIWVKNTNELVIDKWYKRGDYHKNNGEGLDYYSVSQTLGAGDVAPFLNGTLYYSKHYRTYELLDNGPLRSTFKLNFEPWDVDGRKVELSKTITLDAGSQLNRVVLDYHFDGKATLTIAAGIAKREKPGELLKSPEEGIVGYWEPEHGSDGITGVGILFENPIDSIRAVGDQYLSFFNVQSGVPVQYYNGGSWNKAGRITSAEEWFNYLKQYKTEAAHPLEISFN